MKSQRLPRRPLTKGTGPPSLRLNRLRIVAARDLPSLCHESFACNARSGAILRRQLVSPLPERMAGFLFSDGGEPLSITVQLEGEPIDHHSRCPMCGFVVDEFVIGDVLEHVRFHRSVPWRAWWRDPRRAWDAFSRPVTTSAD